MFEKELKHFVYVEIADGGFEEHLYQFKNSSPTFKELYGWMDHDVIEDDQALVEWADKAEIGEYTTHRLGMVFRVVPEIGNAVISQLAPYQIHRLEHNTNPFDKETPNEEE